MIEPASTVREIYAAFASGDVAAILERVDPELEWTTPETLPWSRGAYRGPAELQEYFGAFLAAMDDPAVEPDELVTAGERVMACGHERGRCRATGRIFEARFVHDWTVRDGRVTRMRGLVDTALIAQAFAPAQPAGR